MTTRWYCIQIQPMLRETADFNLKRQNFTPFWPRITTKRQGKLATEAMFKGYGFVQFDVERDRWLSVNGTRGVVGLLPRHGLLPDPMPEGFVETLIEHDPLDESQFVEVFTDFVPDMAIEVATNHRYLAGQRGTVVAVRTKMLQIALSGYTKSRPVWMDREDVFPVKD